MKVRGTVVRVGLKDGCELAHRVFQIAGFNELHRQTVAGKRIRGVLSKELFKDFDAGGFQ